MKPNSMELLILDGPPAFSNFALEKVVRAARAHSSGRVNDLYAEYVHLLWINSALDEEEIKRSQALLSYGPKHGLPERRGEPVGVVLPRRGTISPWSSKASDIFRICELHKVVRVERGIRWYLDGACDFDALMTDLHVA